MLKKTIVYHANCMDGAAAAWVVGKKYLHDLELLPASHGQEPRFNFLKGKDIIMVDFSYKREAIERINRDANSLIIYDHHRSAQQEIGDLPYFIFDENKSGCGLAWDELFPNKPRPYFINYIEDRDLWRWTLPHSKLINNAIYSYPAEVESIEKLLYIDQDDLRIIGEALEKQKEKDISTLLKEKNMITFYLVSRRQKEWIDKKRSFHNRKTPILQNQKLNEFYKVPAVNTSIHLSDIGNILAKGVPFAVIWHHKANGRIKISLRSDENGEDVSRIAERFGGGGHKHAAGFILENKRHLPFYL